MKIIAATAGSGWRPGRRLGPAPTFLTIRGAWMVARRHLLVAAVQSSGLRLAAGRP
jgi:hypothetical protein